MGSGTDGSRHKIFAVAVNWYSDSRKWNVNDYTLDENGNWNAKNHVNWNNTDNHNPNLRARGEVSYQNPRSDFGFCIYLT